MILILASASPRRKELIRLLDFDFRSMMAQVDENSVHHPDPATDVIETAQLKAQDIARLVSGGAIVLGADTTVVLEGERFNKPADASEARVMLQRLRGRTHQVYTGLFLIQSDSGQSQSEVACMNVPMRPYSDDEIEEYLSTGDPLDKAGAYAIQHPEFQPVTGFSDCYAGVVGLPLCHLARALRRFGCAVSDEIAEKCQVALDYDCPVYREILGEGE